MKQIPFCANHPDGTHCYQAALSMVLQGLGEVAYSFDKLDQITGKLPGKWTWPTQSFLWLLDHEFELRLIETFDYEKFGKEGKKYLQDKYGKEVADSQEVNSDLEREQGLALQFAHQKILEDRVPEWGDLEQLLKEGFLVICNINANELFHQEGYSGHFVVLLDVTSEEIVLHDPGLPPKPSLKVSKELFEKAWSYPSQESRNLLGIRLLKPVKF